jgi:hypothetical protein
MHAAKGKSASKSAPIMPGCNVSAKRSGHIRGNIDALRHNWKPLLRSGKERAAGSGPGVIAEGDAGKAGLNRVPREIRPDEAAMRKRMPQSAIELVKEVEGAGREHAEQSQTHCHCEIHITS